jgi:hypothetical protein
VRIEDFRLFPGVKRHRAMPVLSSGDMAETS